MSLVIGIYTLRLNPQLFALEFSYKYPSLIKDTNSIFLITGDSTAQFNLNPKFFDGGSYNLSFLATPAAIINRELMKNVLKFNKNIKILYMYSFSRDHY